MIPTTGPPFEAAGVRAAARVWLEDLHDKMDGRAWWYLTHLPPEDDATFAGQRQVVRWYQFKAAQIEALLALLDGERGDSPPTGRER